MYQVGGVSAVMRLEEDLGDRRGWRSWGRWLEVVLVVMGSEGGVSFEDSGMSRMSM